MLVPSVIPFLLLAAYVLLTSAAISDKNGLQCAHQRPAHLHFNVHKIHQQQLSLQLALESPPPELSCTVASMYPSLKLTKIGTLTQDSTHTNSTQLAHDSNDSWSRASLSVSSQGKTLNDGLISRIKNPDLATNTGDFEGTSIEQQHNDATNVPDEEECPRGVDKLDCGIVVGQNRLGRPVQTDSIAKVYVMSAHLLAYKAKWLSQIEEQNDRWKDCHCLNWENARGPCTFDYDSDDTSNDRLAVEEELRDSTNETGYLDETSIEQQLNDATNTPDDEECPTGADTLDCGIVVDQNRPGRLATMTITAKALEPNVTDGKIATASTGKVIRDPADLAKIEMRTTFRTCRIYQVLVCDSEDLVDEHGDADGEPANDEVLLESTAERAAAVTEEEKRWSERG